MGFWILFDKFNLAPSTAQNNLEHEFTAEVG